LTIGAAGSYKTGQGKSRAASSWLAVRVARNSFITFNGNATCAETAELAFFD